MNFYSLYEFNDFTSYFEDDPIANLIGEIMLWTNCRPGELLALTPSDFEFNKHTMVINKIYQSTKAEDIVQYTKTCGRKRSVTLPENLSTKIQAYL